MPRRRMFLTKLRSELTGEWRSIVRACSRSDADIPEISTLQLIYQAERGEAPPPPLAAAVLQFSRCENRKGIYFISREIPAE